MSLRFINDFYVSGPLLVWYLIPVTVGLSVGWCWGGWSGLLVGAIGIVWPLGNIVLGIAMGCD